MVKHEISHIISLCTENDRKAQRTLFEMYNKRLYAIALNYLKDNEEAKEACHVAWIEIFKSLKNFKDQGSFDGWIKRIVIRVCWKMIRKDRTLEHLDNYADEGSYVEVSKIYDKMECEELLNLLEVVPKVSRAVFLMHVVDGLSHTEIAEAMDFKVVTSRAHLFKARKLLKEKYFLMNRIARNEL